MIAQTPKYKSVANLFAASKTVLWHTHDAFLQIRLKQPAANQTVRTSIISNMTFLTKKPKKKKFKITFWGQRKKEKVFEAPAI